MAEKEYIEREELKQAFAADTQSIRGWDIDLFDLLMLEIDEAPAADVAPVRHGHWEQGDIYDIGDVCSICQYDSLREPCEYKFCPNCGARMGSDTSG